MAIEDGYFLARALDGVDLHDSRAISAAFEVYEAQRVDYVNHNMEFARFLGRLFHDLPRPLANIRCHLRLYPGASRVSWKWVPQESGGDAWLERASGTDLQFRQVGMKLRQTVEWDSQVQVIEIINVIVNIYALSNNMVVSTTRLCFNTSIS